MKEIDPTSIIALQPSCAGMRLKTADVLMNALRDPTADPFLEFLDEP